MAQLLRTTVYVNELTNTHCIRQVKEMRRKKENARYNVVCMRVSETEMESLQEIMVRTRKSVTELMREALRLYASSITT